MTIPLAPEDFSPARRLSLPVGWRAHLAALAVVAGILLAMFWRDVVTLVTIWWTSTTYGHCLFIGPVVGWLVWNRRRELAQLTPQAWAPGLALVALGGFGWLVGDAAGVALARQLGLVMMLQGAVVTLLGPNVARGLLFPLAYAVFLVPFGEEMERPLQSITVAMVMPLLHLFGVAASNDGVLITTSNGWFEVAEACSGAKFVIAMIAYATLVANVCFHSWRRRAGFMMMALVVPVIANGLRAFGTIYAAYLTSVAAATGFDHIVYGWIFFALVMAGVIAIGWRWFDKGPDDPAFDPARLQAPVRYGLDTLVAGALVLAVAAAFPAWSQAIAGRHATLPDRIALPQVPGWTAVDTAPRAPWAPNYPGADRFVTSRYRDAAGDLVDMAVAVYASQHEGKEIVAFGVGPIRENDRWVRIADVAPIAWGRAMRMTAGPVERQVATWYRVGGVLTASDSRVKLATLEAKLLGGDQRAVAVHVSAEVLPGHDAHAAIARFAAALGPLDAVADRISR